MLLFISSENERHVMLVYQENPGADVGLVFVLILV
jgi:hypothetical protein